MALFNYSIDQFRKLVPGLTTTFELEDARPELEITESSILPAFLGDTLSEQLVELADLSDEDLSDPADRNLKRALYLTQVAIGRIGLAAYLPFAETQIGQDGITVTNSAERKAAFEYQTNALKRTLVDSGWKAFDELISLVASHPDEFPGWSESPYYQEHEQALFKNAAEFSKYYPIQNRWLTFWALRPFMSAVEENQGASGLAQLTALPNATPDGVKTKLKRDLLRALAYQTVLNALPNLSVELNGANVQVNYASQFGNATYYQPPGKDHLSWVMANLKNQVDLAWSVFNTGLAEISGPTSATNPDAGLIYGNGAVSML